MVTPLNMRHNLYRAPTAIRDPGSAGTIIADIDGGVCSVVTAGAEARTLRQPTKAGITCTVVLDTAGGALTLTVTGGYNAAGATAIVFSAAGNFVQLVSVKIGASYVWRVLAVNGTNVSVNASSIIQTQGAPAVISDGAATLSIANLLTKIVQMTPTAGRTLTLPTGTLTDGGVSMAVGEAFDWTVLNAATATHALTVAAGTDHTVVGGMVVAAASSGLFRTRKTAANTFITYRIG